MSVNRCRLHDKRIDVAKDDVKYFLHSLALY